MKRIYCLALVIGVIFLRETGVIGMNLFRHTAQFLTSNDTNAFPKLNATRLEFIEDDGKPLRPRAANIEETYHVLVRYKFTETLTWARWIPLVKCGKNRVQLIYTVWEGENPMGLGVIDCDGTLNVFGLCSAWEYRNMLTHPLVEKMKETAKGRIEIFTYQGSQ
ncbi:MAG: hypothetical protein ACFUZC_22850 [Chthoniobacteraceae bacterium]